MTTSLWIVAVFAGIGVLDTLYLSYHAITKREVVCWWFPKEWCRRVQYSPHSKTLGIPNPFLGLGMYIAILILLAKFSGGDAPFWLLQAVVAFGFAFSLYFTYIQAFVLRAFCTWCVISAVNFTVMFLVLFVL